MAPNSNVLSQVRNIRLAHGRSNESAHFKIGLYTPGEVTPVEERLPDHVYVEDYLPSNNDHDAALGNFMSKWDALEMTMASLFQQLTEYDMITGSAIVHSLGSRRIAETIRSLATRKLQDSAIESLEKLLSRHSALSRKRNIIVHGYWVLEIFFYAYRGSQVVKGVLLREGSPMDHRVAKRLNNPRCQQDRAQFCFNIKRIKAIGDEADALSREIVNFSRYSVPPQIAMRYTHPRLYDF